MASKYKTDSTIKALPFAIGYNLRYNESNLIEKINGRWLLTENGNKLYLWAKKAISEQSYIEEQKKVLRIGTTREFASRILKIGRAHV